MKINEEIIPSEPIDSIHDAEEFSERLGDAIANAAKVYILNLQKNNPRIEDFPRDIQHALLGDHADRSESQIIDSLSLTKGKRDQAIQIVRLFKEATRAFLKMTQLASTIFENENVFPKPSNVTATDEETTIRAIVDGFAIAFLIGMEAGHNDSPIPGIDTPLPS